MLLCFPCTPSAPSKKFSTGDVKDLKLPFSAGLPYVPPAHTIALGSLDTRGLTSPNLPLEVAMLKHFRNQKCDTAKLCCVWNPWNTKTKPKSTTSSLSKATPAPSNASAAWCFTWLNPALQKYYVHIASTKTAVRCDFTSENTARHMRCQDDDRYRLHSFLPYSHSISTTQWCRKVLLPLKLCRMKVTLHLVM